MDPIIILLRIVVPLTIFRFPLLGGLASVFLDGIDWHVHFFPFKDLHANYILLDKLLDIYYLTIEALVVWRWKDAFAKKLALSLYGYRLVGTLLVFLTKNLFFFVLFPNIFENFFLFYVACWAFLRREPRISPKFLLCSVVVIAIPKILQEYAMHITADLWSWRYTQIYLSKTIHFQYDNVIGQGLILAGWILIICLISLQKKRK